MDINSQQFGTWCFDNGVRIGWILPIASANDGERATEILDDWIEGATEDRLTNVFGDGIKEYFNGGDDSSDREKVLSFINDNRLSGFLIRIERQVRRYDTKCRGVFSAGWGHMVLETWYSDSIGPDFVERIVAWSDAMLKKEKANRVKITISTH